MRPPVHRPALLQLRTERQAYDRDRGSSAKRGYGRRWRRFRLAYLAAHPLCADCEAAGVVAPAIELHHIQRTAARPDLMFDECNVLGLCKTHHSLRTVRGE